MKECKIIVLQSVNNAKEVLQILTDIGSWLDTAVVSGWFGAVPVSLPVRWTQTPAHSVLVGEGTSVITYNRSVSGTGWGNVMGGLGSLTRPSYKMETKALKTSTSYKEVFLIRTIKCKAQTRIMEKNCNLPPPVHKIDCDTKHAMIAEIISCIIMQWPFAT